MNKFLKLHWKRSALLGLLAIMAFTEVSARSANSYKYRTTVSANPTGAGTVYATYVDASSTTGSNPYDATVRSYDNQTSVTLTATPAEGYRFLRWESSDGTVISNTSTSPTTTLTYNTNGARYTSHNGFLGIGAYTEYTTQRVFSFTAYFALKGAVDAKVADGQETLGSAVVVETEINPGEEVTLVASTINGSELAGWAFDYWELNGENVSEESTIKVTVPMDETKLVYVAHFAKADTENYCFIRNKATGRYLRLSDTKDYTAPTESNPVASFNGSYTLVDESKAISDPACVFILAGTSNQGGVKNASLISQDVSTGYLKDSKIITTPLSVRPYNEGTYSISTVYTTTVNLKKTDYTLYFRDNNGTPDMTYTAGATSEWEILTLNSSTLEQQYFCAVPNERITRYDRYYTTLYTSFPYKLQSGKAFYVVGEESIKVEESGLVRVFCKEITDGVIPAYFPVILRFDGTDPAGNKLLPLPKNTEVTRPTNLLRGNIKVQNGTVKGDGNIYVLSVGTETGVGFYKLKSGMEMPDNKAYAVIDESLQSYAKNVTFAFGDDDVDVDMINETIFTEDNAGELVYDLQGRQVRNPLKGVYVIKGRKVIIK